MTEKLYYQNPYQRRFGARVLKCTEKDGRWQVVLNRTAFYPEDGGQPSDTGVLDAANVLGAEEHGVEIVHFTDRPLPVGSTVMGSINWPHRFGLMQQHTGEHIVSGIANRFFGVENVGFHMGEKFLTVDWSGRLTKNQIVLVERLTNEAVYRNLPVRAEFPTAEELAKMEYRSKKALTGAIRIVTVPGYDVCACCGTHVAFTGEIGAVKILSSQNYKGGTRITLACGAQAMNDYAEKQESVAQISALLSAKPEEVAQAVRRLMSDSDGLKRQLSEIREQLLQRKAESVPMNSGSVCVFESNLPPEELRKFAVLLARRCGGTAVVFNGKDNAYRYALANAGQDDIRPIGKALNDAFAGRGGGSRELVQGTLKGTQVDLKNLFATLTKRTMKI